MSNLENKEKILKNSRENHQLTYKCKHIRITSELSAQTLKARKVWSNITQSPKKNDCQLRIPYLAKLSFNLNRGLTLSKTRIS
jgi:hypothetical protein